MWGRHEPAVVALQATTCSQSPHQKYYNRVKFESDLSYFWKIVDLYDNVLARSECLAWKSEKSPNYLAFARFINWYGWRDSPTFRCHFQRPRDFIQSNKFDEESLLAMIRWIISPRTSSLKTSFQEKISLRNATGDSVSDIFPDGKIRRPLLAVFALIRQVSHQTQTTLRPCKPTKVKQFTFALRFSLSTSCRSRSRVSSQEPI